MKADIKAADRGEPITLMEPLLVGSDSRHRPALTDLAFELTQKSAGCRSLPQLAGFTRQSGSGDELLLLQPH
jgi:hypothetical protein